MVSSVRIDEETRSRLEELRAEIRLRTGERVTRQQLLSRLVERAYESRDDVVDSFRSSTVPLSEAEKSAMRSGRFASGGEFDEEDVDDALY